VPVTPQQIVLFASLAAPGLAVMVRYAVRYAPDGVIVDSHPTFLSLVAATLGVLTAYLVMLVLCTPAAILDPGDPPLRDPVAMRIWKTLSGQAALRNVVAGLRNALSRVAYWLHLRYLLDPATGRLYPAHFLAATIVGLLVILWALFDYLFHPEGAGVVVAPIVHVWVSLLMFIWVFGALEFHLSRLRISPLAVMGAVFVLGYALLSVDHEYTVKLQPASRELDPVAVVGGGSNLVVIASAGGGISAAVWTTLGLERLVEVTPDLLRDIRLLSTISGGSVGAAYFVDGILRRPVSAHDLSALPKIRTSSAASSLGAVAYGLAFRDFPSLLTGGFYPLVIRGSDRGELLERAWARIAVKSMDGEGTPRGAGRDDGKRSLESLRPKIENGDIPGFIFGSTVMESGRRLMVTPIKFPTEDAGSPAAAIPGTPAAAAVAARPHLRALTLSEYLAPEGGSDNVDLDLWTAARLSATFSFVSPAARSTLADDQQSRKAGGLEQRRLWHHLIDGGYYDNFGVTSALDWLTPVLTARAEGNARLRFERVAIIELRAFHRYDPTYAKPAAGSLSALLGPLLGLAAIRDGAAAERDDIEVGRFIKVWRNLFASQPKSAGLPSVSLASFVFEPDEDQPSPPLSWQLSSSQLARLMESWPALQCENVVGAQASRLQQEFQRLRDFLKLECPRKR